MLVRCGFQEVEEQDKENIRPSDTMLCELAPNGTKMARLSIDKIGLQTDISAINSDRIKAYEKGYLTIMRWGNCVRIMVHAEYRREIDNIGQRCLLGIKELMAAGVFKTEVKSKIQEKIDEQMLYGLCGYEGWAGNVIVAFFKLAEWETAMDFYYVWPNRFTSSSSFHRFMGTIYSNDFRCDSKGMRASFIKIYERPRQPGDQGPCYRLEFLHKNQNAQDLKPELLNGTIADAYRLLLPSIARIMRQTTKPQELVFAGAWIQLAPWWFRELLEASGWYYPETNDLPRPRRSRKT